MLGSTRGREFWLGGVIVAVVLLVVIGFVAVMVWDRDGRSRAPALEVSDEWRSVSGVRDVVAVDESRRVPGEDFGEEDRWEHSVRVEVTLENDLSGAAAAAAGREVLRLLEPEIARLVPDAPADRISTAFTLGSTENWVGASGLDPLDTVGDALADAVALREAGATSVSLSVSQPQTKGPGKADVRAPKDVLFQVATVAGRRQRPVDLLGGKAWYRSNELPDPAAVRLVVDASEHASVTSAQLSAPFEPLIVLVEAAEGDGVIDDVSRWLTTYDGYPGRSGQPLAYTVQGTRGGEVEGWVGGTTPPRTTMPPFGDAEPWPPDPAAPPCRMPDLEVTFGGHDAAAGSRQAWIGARNAGGQACAIEGVPAVEFLNAEGAAQTGVTVRPYEPSMVPERVVVPAGESVTAVIDWQAMSTANDPDVTTDLQVTALPGGKPVTIPVSWPGAPSNLDILDGAEVRMSPWAQGTSG
ncbi:DUF4232 domain-containing protein [Nocardioides sp. NBC_00850]|uniref:DUF4232 domain-containing protein n=1 Tax=Nocardioides sp. NBC_00850 TaxID=2976001 RepID=UPI0038705EB3|nr:DUF4232 domain-containing protein [Nocardioides sp. NBC_00850]